MSQTRLVKCPLCGTHKPIERTGIRRLQKGKAPDRVYTFTFDHVDIDNSAFISVRDCQGKKGFPEAEKITLKEALDKDLYPELRQSLINQCVKILETLTGY